MTLAWHEKSIQYTMWYILFVHSESHFNDLIYLRLSSLHIMVKYFYMRKERIENAS